MDASLVLEDFVNRSRIPHIIYNLKPRLWQFFFGWSAMRKFSEVPALSVRSPQRVQRERIYFPFVVKKT